MTVTASGTSPRCDYAGCNKAGMVAHQAWFFCDEHAAPGRAHAAKPTSTPPLRSVPNTTLAAPPAPSPIGQLLEQASAHGNARVRKAAERIEQALDTLRATIADLAADEAHKQAEAAAKEKARAEVARLEKQLADAKAALRAGKRRATNPGNSKPRTPAQLEALAKGRAARAAKRAAATEAQQ